MHCESLCGGLHLHFYLLSRSEGMEVTAVPQPLNQNAYSYTLCHRSHGTKARCKRAPCRKHLVRAH